MPSNNGYYRDTHIAYSLASLLDAAVLATAADRIPHAAMREPRHLSPTEIVALGSEFTDGVCAALAQAHRIIVFTGDDDIPESAVRQISKHAELLRFDDEGLCSCNEQINDWVRDGVHEDGGGGSPARSSSRHPTNNLIDNFSQYHRFLGA